LEGSGCLQDAIARHTVGCEIRHAVSLPFTG
jgi:hypothetical protein